MQSQALVAGIALGFNGITRRMNISTTSSPGPGKHFSDQRTRDVIKDIIIIDGDWQVTDSLNPRITCRRQREKEHKRSTKS